MSRIDAQVLKDAIAHVNDRMARAGADYHYRYGSLNGYHTVDGYKGPRNLFRVGSGTPRECISALYVDAFDRVADGYAKLLATAVGEFTDMIALGPQ